MKNKKYSYVLILSIALFALCMFGARGRVKADEVDEPLLIATREESVTMITDVAGLLAMELDPSGSYRLAADVDASGVEWFPYAFHGELDGNGYSILNLNVLVAGESIRETYDGNMKVYDTYFAGLFDELSGGSVRNLNLVNLRVRVETDSPCFVGAIAGYMENATIENCSVQGRLELWAHDRMFGVGGIIGYGCGEIRDCSADVTLVCVDTDASTKDEQFMGGVCAAGYPDLHGNVIKIAGYDSDHGYVHDGGLVGMYMFYPKGMKYKGSITDNYVSGKITFFEDNKNRRAYCNGFIGEIMNWDFENGRNKNDFERDEVFKYDVNLLPHSCDNPVMTEEVIEPSCEFGYVKRVCETCGYEETDHYTLKVHDFEWTDVKEATEKEEGLREGVCKNCGATTQESIPVIIPQKTEEPEILPEGTFGGDLSPSQNEEAAKEKKGSEKPKNGFGGNALMIMIIVLAVAVMGLLMGFAVKRKRK